MATIENADSNPANSDDQAVTELKFVTHLKQYPVVVSAKNLILGVPFMKSIYSTAKSVSASIGITFICSVTDSFADGALNTVDKYFPSLKTITAEDVTGPIVAPVAHTIGTVQMMSRAAELLFDENITQPTKKVTNEVEDYVHKTVYTEEGKNKILSPMDPLVEPLNNKITEVVTHFKPNTKKVTKAETSSEIARSKRIVWNFVTGSKQK